MGSTMLEIISSLAQNIYNFMSSVVYPGTNFSFFGLMVIVALTTVAIAAIRMFLGMPVALPRLPNAPFDPSTHLRGGNNKRIMIADNRKGDTR